MYKYIKSIDENKLFDEVVGIDKLLVKLEYNAFTKNGRIASDYGSSTKSFKTILRIQNYQKTLKIVLDEYEKKSLDNLEKILEDL